MDEISDFDFKEFVKTVQDLALRAYPNPGRADCPGSQVIHEVASLSRPAAHPAFQSHIVRCSPCIQEVLGERTRIQSQRKNRRRALLAIAAGVCILALVSLLLLRQRSGAPLRDEIARVGNVPEIPLDLRPYSPTRSASPEKSKPSVTVPSGRVRLKVYLALESPEGAYEIQVLTNKLQTLRSQQATVVANGSTVFLPVDIDLAGLPAGTYVLALRPARESEEWQAYSLVLKRAP
jgi:hypothetical protein